MIRFRAASGFSLIELLIATTVLLIVSSIATSGLMQMSKHQQTVWNRTEMHSGIRGATELLQQEVGQAGRVALPAGAAPGRSVRLSAAVTGVSPCTTPVPVTLTSSDSIAPTSGMFLGESLTILDGDAQESVLITEITPPSQIKACFTQTHAINAVLVPLGGFATGIVPHEITNGSDGYRLKMYGDINGDGQMVYVEYFCDNGDAGTGTPSQNLYRQVLLLDAVSKLAPTNSEILLSNVYKNPPPPGSVTPVPCFTYQTSPITINGVSVTFVIDVAITLTVQTQQIDQVTKAYQTETKALLNVSPRNVVNAWASAGMGNTQRVQSTPGNVIALIAPTP